MITESFDESTPAILQPRVEPEAPQVDACILTFSHEIEDSVLQTYACERIGALYSVTGETPVWRMQHEGNTFAFFKTSVGAPACVGTIEDSFAVFQTDKYILFGGAGCLNKEIARGKVMVPTEAYRDEGTSYHYAPPADYIPVRNAETVAACMRENGIPCVLGKTWTTDALYRETRGNFEKRKAEGCISVEMECAAAQAVCDFRKKELYAFFTSGDLLDAPEWDARLAAGQKEGSQHDVGHFAIALALAHFAARRA